MYPKSHSFKWQKVPEPRQFDVMAATLNHMTSIFKGWKSVPIKNNAKKPKRHRFQKHSKSGLTTLEELSASCQSTCIHKSAMNNSESCRREIPDAYTHWHPPDHRQLHPKWEYRAKLHLKTPRAEKSRKRCAASCASCNEQAWGLCNRLIPYLIHFLFHKFPQLPCIWKKRTSHLLRLSWPRFLTHFYCCALLCKEKTVNIHLPQFRNSDT